MQKKLQEISSKEDFHSLSPEEIKKFEFFLKKLAQTSFQDIQKKFRENVPVEIFAQGLSPLEALVKYLKENLDFTNRKIADLLGRSIKTIWQAYKSASKKFSKQFKFDSSKYFIPISIFSKRQYSILELVVAYLKENYELENHQIAKLLKRDNRTVWTVYSRFKKKKVKQDQKG